MFSLSTTQRGCNYNTGGGRSLISAFSFSLPHSLSGLPPKPSAAEQEAPAGRAGRAGPGTGSERPRGAGGAGGAAGRCLPPARPLTRRRSRHNTEAMAAAAGEAAGGGGGSPSSARRRLRIISGHLRGSPRAPGRGALSPSPCKAQGGSAGPASGSIPKKRWVRAGRAPGARGRGCGPGSGPPALWQRSPPARGRARAGGARGGPAWAPREERGSGGSGGEEGEAHPGRGWCAEGVRRSGDWRSPKEGGLQPLTWFCSK